MERALRHRQLNQPNAVEPRAHAAAPERGDGEKAEYCL